MTHLGEDSIVAVRYSSLCWPWMLMVVVKREGSCDVPVVAV